MSVLQSKIKDLEACSLSVFKEHNHPRYIFMILFFSPDDFHSYIGFRKESDSFVEQKTPFIERNVSVELGNFYIDTLTDKLFIDSPNEVLKTLESEYRQAFKRFNNLDQFRSSYTKRYFLATAEDC
jgi:hypothetical protein